MLTRKPRVPGKDHLVDWQLVVQAYGVTGTIETVCSFAMAYWYMERQGYNFWSIWFAFGAYPEDWNQDEFQHHLVVASSIYFINLVVMQWFNLLAVRTRRLSIFQHPPFFNKDTQNLYLIPSVIFSLVIAFIWLYPKPIRDTLDTAPVPVEYWFLPMATGTGLLLLDEARKFFVRKYPEGILARMAW